MHSKDLKTMFRFTFDEEFENTKVEELKRPERKVISIPENSNFDDKLKLYHKRGFDYESVARIGAAMYIGKTGERYFDTKEKIQEALNKGAEFADKEEFIRWFEDIKSKLMHDGYEEHVAEFHAEQMLLYLPNISRINIDEWLHGEDVSEQKYKNISLKEILDGTKKYNFGVSFAKATEYMITYIADGCRNEDRFIKGYYEKVM